MLEELKKDLLPHSARLVAVSKTKPNEAILDLHKRGHRAFGENRALELAEKYEALPKDVEWHFIGRLQTNKIKYIASFVHLIHSVDRAKVLRAINKEAAKVDRVIDCLLQFHIAQEESKAGFDLPEVIELLNSLAEQPLDNVRMVGVMGMATYTDDKEQVRREFQQLKSYFDQLKAQFFAQADHFREISMGMSGDYRIALEEGSTMVRIGSLLFGKR